MTSTKHEDQAERAVLREPRVVCPRSADADQELQRQREHERQQRARAEDRGDGLREALGCRIEPEQQPDPAHEQHGSSTSEHEKGRPRFVHRREL